MAKRTLQVPVPTRKKAAGDPLLQALISSGGELYSALKAAKVEVRRDKKGIVGIWFNHSDVTDAGLEALGSQTRIAEFQAGERMTDAGLVHLRDMTVMERLMFHRISLAGDGLKHLARMSQLRDFQLPGCEITNFALSHLPHLPALRTFSLDGCSGFTDRGLACLDGLEGLEYLSLGGAPIKGPGLHYLSALPALESLRLAGGIRTGTKLRDHGLSHLPSLPKLQVVELGGSRVTDAGLRHLAVLPSLEYLNLEGTSVSDRGMKHIAALPHLKSVNLNHTRVTIRGVREVKAARPSVSITATGREDVVTRRERLELTPRPKERKAAPVAQSWKRIERWLGRHLPEVLKTLRPAAKPADLNRLEKKIGRPLPGDFRDSYLIHDGQDWSLPDERGNEDDWDEGDTHQPGVIFGTHIHPLVGDYGVLWLYEHRVPGKWPSEDSLNEDWEFYPPGAIREAWNGPGWVPFDWDFGRNFLGIDLEPGLHGVVGQVIPFGGDDEFRPVLALSFAHFLQDIADELEAGQGVVEPDEVSRAPFHLKGAPRGNFANCYKEWAKAKLPLEFQQAARKKPVQGRVDKSRK